MFLASVLSTAALAASFLFQNAACAGGDMLIDGGDELGWNKNSWYVQVDGVMGGKSSGNMEFLESNDGGVLRFTGDISLDGGGFSSVRRRIDLDLSDYAGVVVTMEASSSTSTNGAVLPPTGIHLQLGDASSYYDYSSAFAVPLAVADESGGTTTTAGVYLPMESFDRGSSFGFTCRNGCELDSSRINNLSVYVLFQEGPFDVKLRSIEAVREPRSFATPAFVGDSGVLGSAEEVVALLRSTISSGGGLYDKSYIELCIAMYWSVLNTLLEDAGTTGDGGDGAVPDPVRALICSGLRHTESIAPSSKQDRAWALRYTIDAAIADLSGTDRSATSRDWLLSPSEARAVGSELCTGRTSPAPGPLHDPVTGDLLVPDEAELFDDDDDDEATNSTGVPGSPDESQQQQAISKTTAMASNGSKMLSSGSSSFLSRERAVAGILMLLGVVGTAW